MSMLRSPRQGDRALALRDWLVAYACAWIVPVPVGLAMVVLPVLYRWPFEALAWPIPFETPVSLVFGLGWVVMFSPAFSWIGLALSVPVVWMALRMGLGGWAIFAIGGAGLGALAGQIVDGMHPLFPGLIGLGVALVLHKILSWIRPSAIIFRSGEVSL